MKKVLLLIVFISQICFAQENSKQELIKEADKLSKIVKETLSKDFLKKVVALEEAPVKTIMYYDKENRKAYTESEYESLQVKPEGAKKREYNDKFYYYTGYGSPLSYVSTLEILGKHGFKIKKNTNIIDFGFGYIGHLSLFTKMGANKVSGVEVSPILEALYKNREGNLNLVYGMFPYDKNVVDKVGKGYDLFVTKNTLKKGFITPEKERGIKPMIDFKVSHEDFVKSVYDILKKGGYMLIYNIHNSAEKDYKPWKDGRSPYEISLYEKVGFKVLSFNEDHTDFIKLMAKALGWEKSMDIENDLFATYTLVQKK